MIETEDRYRIALAESRHSLPEDMQVPHYGLRDPLVPMPSSDVDASADAVYPVHLFSTLPNCAPIPKKLNRTTAAFTSAFNR